MDQGTQAEIGIHPVITQKTFIKGLQGSIRHIMRAYCGTHKTAALSELALQAMSLRSLQYISASTATVLSPMQAQGRPNTKLDLSNQNVLIIDSSPSNNMNDSPTNYSRSMACSKGSIAMPSRRTPTTHLKDSHHPFVAHA